MNINGRNPNGTFAAGNGYGKIKRTSIKNIMDELLQAEHKKDKTKLHAICNKLIEMALNGSIKAAELIFAYTDGKPRQQIEIYDDRQKDSIVFVDDERIQSLSKEELIEEIYKILNGTPLI